MSTNYLKTWIELNEKAVGHNYRAIKGLLGPKTQLWAVVKSNAYGHGLIAFSKLADKFGVGGFCVDSVLEGLKLREAGIKKPILVLGPTFPNLLKIAAENRVAITISNQEALTEFLKSKHKPEFHLKIDTGMHRQGFYVEELSKIKELIRHPPRLAEAEKIKNFLKGTYTHFASAKDINYPTFTDIQFQKFQTAIKILESAGFKNLLRHCAATGGTLINSKYHLDAVRIGIGLYGLWPSRELEIQLQSQIRLQPVLSWKALISEVKNVPRGEYVGYDLTEKTVKPTQIAIIPVGYWHGLPRMLSGCGEVVINGKRAKFLGRVSMDIIAVDATGINCGRGDTAILVGEKITTEEVAQKIGASHYELVTRINPLIERIIT